MQNDTNNPDTLATSATGSFGEALRQARTRKNLSLDDATKETFILKRHLQALEEQNFESLPQMAFAKGFASNYAKYLGLDATAITQQFEASYPAHLQPKSTADIRSPLQPMGTLNRESRGSIKFNPLFIIGLIGALGLGVFIYKTVNKAHTDTQPVTPASATQGINPQDKATGASLANTGSAISATHGTMNSATTTTTATTATMSNAGSAIPSAGSAIVSAVPASTSATANTNTNGTAQLDFWVKDTTNISVTDATGKALLQGDQARGGYKISGQPPFTVAIDNVKNVNIDMNKQPLKLSDYIPAGQAQSNQVNFTLK